MSAVLEHEHVDTPVLVTVVGGNEPEQTAPSDLSSYRTISIAATDTEPIKILAQDKRRHKATIAVHNPLGVAVPAIPPYVFVGQQGQVRANGDARGAAIVAGDLFPYECAAEMWLTPAGVAVSVTIIEERYVK